MSTPYQINFTLDTDTLATLQDQGYQLYAFKSVASSTQGAKPLVWFSVSTKKLLANVSINWTEQYQAFINESTAIGTEGSTVDASASIDADLGQIVVVDPHGNLSAETNGVANALTIENDSTNPLVCGISQQVNGAMKQLCAFPLYGQNADVIMPKEKVLLMFSTNVYETATVIERAFSKGLLIDLTGNHSRTVSFDLNTGWSAGDVTWATNVGFHALLADSLIEISNDLRAVSSERSAEAQARVAA